MIYKMPKVKILVNFYFFIPTFTLSISPFPFFPYNSGRGGGVQFTLSLPKFASACLNNIRFHSREPIILSYFSSVQTSVAIQLYKKIYLFNPHNYGLISEP